MQRSGCNSNREQRGLLMEWGQLVWNAVKHWGIWVIQWCIKLTIEAWGQWGMRSTSDSWGEPVKVRIESNQWGLESAEGDDINQWKLGQTVEVGSVNEAWESTSRDWVNQWNRSWPMWHWVHQWSMGSLRHEVNQIHGVSQFKWDQSVRHGDRQWSWCQPTRNGVRQLRWGSVTEAWDQPVEI